MNPIRSEQQGPDRATERGLEFEVDIADALGARPEALSVDAFVVYIPDRDREGRELGDQRRWVLEALDLLTEINGGATALPPSEGRWRDEGSGIVIRENTVQVYSFLRAARFVESLQKLRGFLHRFGRETRQGEVAFEFRERFYRIQQFDQQAGEELA